MCVKGDDERVVADSEAQGLQASTLRIPRVLPVAYIPGAFHL